MNVSDAWSLFLSIMVVTHPSHMKYVISVYSVICMRTENRRTTGENHLGLLPPLSEIDSCCSGLTDQIENWLGFVAIHLAVLYL